MTSIHTERIATSREGRAVTLVKLTRSKAFGEDPGKVRVMLFAQQHGDEPAGKEALLRFLTRAFAGSLDDVLARVDLLVIPQVNPDGGERRQRRTMDGIDMNRAHVLLHTPEIKALHDLFLAWQPQVTVDLHEYASFNPVWLHSGVIRTADVQMGILSNLNSSPALRSYQRARMLPFVASAMQEHGFKFHEYIVGDPLSGVRHSTTDINDGRQSFGILSTLSFLLEGRKWRSFDDQMERRATSQLTAVEALVRYCAENNDEIRTLVAEERACLRSAIGHRLVLRMDHVSEGGAMVIPGVRRDGGGEAEVRLQPYHAKVHPLATVTLPRAYVVPAACNTVTALLQLHGVQVQRVEKARRVNAWRYMIEGMGVSVLEGEEVPDPLVRLQQKEAMLQPGDAIIPADQLHSRAVGTLLEPGSMWHLCRYGPYRGLLKQGAYPILRLAE